MSQLLDRPTMIQRLIAAAQNDERIVGLVDYGSSSEGRSDRYSDIDVAVFIRERAFEAFAQNWKTWASQFGPLLLAYISGVGHPWTVYDAVPFPLRVDFDLHPESAAAQILTWPIAPLSAAAMIWYDATGGQLTAYARRLVGQSLAPADLAATFERICGDFWYYSLRMLGKLRRGEEWAARYEFTVIVTGLLHALLRLEVGAVGRWRASESAVDIEQVLSPHRLEQLATCIPGMGMPSLLTTLGRAVALASEVCTHIHAVHGWPWPEQLATRIHALLAMPTVAEHSPES